MLFSQLRNTMPFNFNAEFMVKWNACKELEDADNMKALLSTIGPYSQVIDELALMYATSKSELAAKPDSVKVLIKERKKHLLQYIYSAEPKVQHYNHFILTDIR